MPYVNIPEPRVIRHINPYSLITLEKFPFSLRDLKNIKSAFRECKILSGAGKDGGVFAFHERASIHCWWLSVKYHYCGLFFWLSTTESLGELICEGKWFNCTKVWREWFILNMNSTKSSLDIGVVLAMGFVQIQLYISAFISLLSMFRSTRIPVLVLRGNCMYHNF